MPPKYIHVIAALQVPADNLFMIHCADFKGILSSYKGGAKQTHKNLSVIAAYVTAKC